ncbi:Fic family protein [Candidatus Micrarchaeota archaeon]|nr:Fic family protein [Candidatus Micrarchaeota archaeon]
MAFVRERKKGSTFYYELVESVREGGKARQHVLRYLGNREKMLEHCKRHGLKPPTMKYAMLDKGTAFALEGKLKKLNGLRPLPRNTLESLAKKFDVDMTYNSNAIEGNRLSLKETYLVLEKGITIGGKSMREHLEATNHREALHLLGKIADRKAKVAECDVLALHAAILDRISPGNAGFYRREQVFITQSRHMPPKWKDVPGLMKEAITELNSKRQGAAAVESAVKIHHLVSWIHPFVDGNGRMARLLSNLRLMRAGFPPIVLRRRVRKSYYDALESADDGDFRPLSSMVAKELGVALDLWIGAAE